MRPAAGPDRRATRPLRGAVARCLLLLLAAGNCATSAGLRGETVEEAAPAVLGDAAADAGGPCDRAGARPDVWSVVTRGLPEVDGMPARARPAVERLDADGRWRRDDVAGILANPRQPLLVFLHGNRYDRAAAREQGMMLARRTGSICPEASQTRTVIFSWPSDKQGILLRDSRRKYRRAQTEGHYLAWFLSQVEPDRPVAIVGYSYGALIALEALEDLVQAQAAGREGVQPWIGREAPLNLVLVAAAVRHDALAPRGPYRETLPCIDRLTVLHNSDDMALRFFELVDRNLRTDALGHRGMPAAWVAGRAAFTQVDAAGIVGSSHRLSDYLSSPCLMRRICAGAGTGLHARGDGAASGPCAGPAEGPCGMADW